MQAASIPVYMGVVWAQNASDPTFVRTVPVPSQIPTNPGFASFETGYPPTNFQPIASGGVPPFGQDVNGIFRAVTQWLQWQQAGAPVPYDSAFSTAIGGYPIGAIVASLTTPFLRWQSTEDDNTTDPDAGGAGWIPVMATPSNRVVTATGAIATTIKDTSIGLARSGTSSSTLPNAAGGVFMGYVVRYTDILGNMQANKHTVNAPSGHTIAGLGAFVMGVNRMSAAFEFFGNVSGTPTWGIQQ